MPFPSLAALLDPGPTAPALVVTPEHVGGPVAWWDLRRAGALVELRDGAAVAVGAVVGPEHRALALAHEVPARCVLAAATAAWVHTGLFAGRDAPAWPAGVPVTRPARTAVDVACTAPPEAAVPVLVALARGGVDLRAATRALDRRARVVGRPAAHRALSAARELLAG